MLLPFDYSEASDNNTFRAARASRMHLSTKLYDSVGQPSRRVWKLCNQCKCHIETALKINVSLCSVIAHSKLARCTHSRPLVLSDERKDLLNTKYTGISSAIFGAPELCGNTHHYKLAVNQVAVIG